jgi:hypothetical protein
MSVLFNDNLMQHTVRQEVQVVMKQAYWNATHHLSFSREEVLCQEGWEVRVTGDKAPLNYKISPPPRGLTVEEMPVLSTVHFGGPNMTF